MPVMIPPGSGTTVTLPAGGQAVLPQGQAGNPAQPQGRLAAPPSPFRQAHGPDVLIMPHTQEEEQQQFRRPGRILRLARRALKLNRPLTRADLEPFINTFAANPQDDAPHLVFADFLADHGDPREEIVRQQVARGRQRFGEGRFVFPPGTGEGVEDYAFQHNISGSAGGGEQGFIGFTPHRNKPQVLVRWSPDTFKSHASSDYRAVVSPETAHEIARHVGMHSYMARWPDHVKPKIISDPT